MELYPWQRDCLEVWKRNGFRGILHVITGAGKTVAALAGAKALEQNLARQTPAVPLRLRIVTPTIAIARQWMQAVRSAFPRETVSGETGRIKEEPAPEDGSLVSTGTAAGTRPELSLSDAAAAFARFCKTYDLTQREAEIMQMILKSNLPTTQLSGELHVSERTLYRHLSALYQKTGTDSRVGLLMKYYDESK